MGVGDDLDLDVAGATDQLLDEDRVVAESAGGLGAGRTEGLVDLLDTLDGADSPAAPTGGRLDHDRIPESGRMGSGFFGGGDRAAAPSGDGHVGRLGQLFGGDLVAQPSHGLGVGSDEHDAELGAERREVRVFGDETPPDPDGIGLGGEEGFGQAAVVEVADPALAGAIGVGGRSEIEGLVGLSDEHRPPVGFGVERDRPEVEIVFDAVLADRVDEADGRLTPIDDGDALEVGIRVCHSAVPIPERSGASTSSSRLPGIWIVR